MNRMMQAIKQGQESVSSFVSSDSLSYYPGFNNGAMLLLWGLVLLVGIVGVVLAVNMMTASKETGNRPERTPAPRD